MTWWWFDVLMTPHQSSASHTHKSSKTAALVCILLLTTCISSSSSSSGNNNDGNGRRLRDTLADPDKFFYIYEWPSYLDDVWPPENATLHVKSGYDHGFRPNGGAGKAIAPELGLFQTWQFSLYKNLMSRLRTSKQRTRDPSKASAFIIPFDAGVHSYIDHEDGHPRLAAPHGRYAGRYLRQNCQGPTKNLWWKNNGHDHFLIFSVTAYQMVGMMVKELFMFVCQNCTTIIIETTPTGTAPPGRTRKTFFAAPYPSSFHYWEGIKQLPWSPPRPEGTGERRDILSLFIGSVKTSQAASRELRKKLLEQCQAEGAPTCEWRTAAHACNGVVNASDALLLFRRAQYCPAPSGDSLTRKSLFDSLVSGCVPVIFSRASLTQYKWFLSQQDVDEVAVYIPMSQINSDGANFIQILKAIPPAELARKQAAVRRLAPSLQYSIVPDRVREDRGDVWVPPFRDAADVVIEHVLDARTIEPVQGYSDEQLKALNLEQKLLSQTHEDYAAMRTSERTVVDTSKVQKTQSELEKEFLDRAVTKVSRVCDTDNINAWGPQGDAADPPGGGNKKQKQKQKQTQKQKQKQI